MDDDINALITSALGENRKLEHIFIIDKQTDILWLGL